MSHVTPSTLEMLLHLKRWILLKCQQCIQLPRDSWLNLARKNGPFLGIVKTFSKIIGRIVHALEYIFRTCCTTFEIDLKSIQFISDGLGLNFVVVEICRFFCGEGSFNRAY